MVFLAHVLIIDYSDHHQNLISSSLYHPGPLHKISLQSVHNFWIMLSTNKQTDRQINQLYQKKLLGKGGNSFAKEAYMFCFVYIAHVKFQKARFNSNQDIRQVDGDHWNNDAGHMRIPIPPAILKMGGRSNYFDNGWEVTKILPGFFFELKFLFPLPFLISLLGVGSIMWKGAVKLKIDWTSIYVTLR